MTNKKVKIIMLVVTVLVLGTVTTLFRPAPRPHFDKAEDVEAALMGKGIIDVYNALGEPTTRSPSPFDGEKEVLLYKDAVDEPIYIHTNHSDVAVRIDSMRVMCDRAKD